jgi:flavin reductase (DIM6/NTAB) family NADH-FMN oxidoreductase RutF
MPVEHDALARKAPIGPGAGGSTNESRALRSVLGTFVTGVTVITTLDDEQRRHGLTANSFSSVSLDPPLILWCQALASPSHPTFRAARRFAVNILAEDQVEVATRFARSDVDRFAGVPVRDGLEGVPLIEGCAAWLECETVAVMPGGDHAVFLARVDRMLPSDRAPLAFGRGRYLGTHPLPDARRAQPSQVTP